MRVVIIRHAEVDFCWSKRCTSAKFDMDIAVVTHGFYMHTLLQEMKKVGFKMTGTSANFKNGEYAIAEK